MGEPTRFSPLLDLSNLRTLQSTTRYGDAANAIDGDAGTHTATYFESEPWWRIELGKETVVHGVTVTRVPTPSDLPGKGYSDYLNGLEITVGGKPCASVTTSAKPTPKISCAPPQSPELSFSSRCHASARWGVGHGTSIDRPSRCARLKS